MTLTNGILFVVLFRLTLCSGKGHLGLPISLILHSHFLLFGCKLKRDKKKIVIENKSFISHESMLALPELYRMPSSDTELEVKL